MVEGMREARDLSEGDAAIEWFKERFHEIAGAEIHITVEDAGISYGYTGHQTHTTVSGAIPVVERRNIMRLPLDKDVGIKVEFQGGGKKEIITITMQKSGNEWILASRNTGE